MKIKQKLLVTFLVTTLVPVFMLAAYSINQARNLAQEGFEQLASEQVENLETAFNNFFGEVKDNVRYLAASPELTLAKDSRLKNYLNAPSGKSSSLDGSIFEANIYRLFERFGKAHDAYTYVYMGTRDGNYVVWPSTNLNAGYDPRTRPWYKSAISAPGKVVLSDPYYWEADQKTLIGAGMIFSTPENQSYGVMSIDVSLDTLTNMAQKAQLGQHGYMMVIDNKGTVLVDANNTDHAFKKLNSLPDQGYAALNKIDSGSTQITLAGNNYQAQLLTSSELGWKFIALMPESEILAPANKVMWTTLIITVIFAAIVILLAFFLSNMIVKPIHAVSEGLREIAQGEGDLTRRLSIDSNDETGELARWFNEFLSSIHTMVSRVSDTAHQMKAAAEDGRHSAKQMDHASEQQLNEVGTMVAAVTEMSAAANEVAGNCARTADHAMTSQGSSEEGSRIMLDTEASVKALSDKIMQSVDDIRKLEADTRNINTILDVIRGIAEQTNLLALNAAIEAARAGEQGRGFAVVADEVRGLAQRTQVSTEEISKLLDQLNTQTDQVVQEMSSSKEQSEQAVEMVARATASFNEIRHSVDAITDMTTQIASAAEEQHQVSEDINRNIEAIHDSAGEVDKVATHVAKNSDHQSDLSEKLAALVSQFKL